LFNFNVIVVQGRNAAHRHNLTTNNEVVIEGERLTLNKSDTEVVRSDLPFFACSLCFSSPTLISPVQILKLSDELNINEYECFGLLRSTYAQVASLFAVPF
jgi:hypothetical protein